MLQHNMENCFKRLEKFLVFFYLRTPETHNFQLCLWITLHNHYCFYSYSINADAIKSYI